MQRRRILDTEGSGLNSMDLELTAEELKVLEESGEPLSVLDVREPWEYQAARIEGSRHIPMGEIPTRAHQELDPEARMVVVCHHGVRSLNVTHWLRQQGFEQVQSLRGGIDAWSRRIDPTVPLY
jgi:rhodanese-related sulfurtransferase